MCLLHDIVLGYSKLFIVQSIEMIWDAYNSSILNNFTSINTYTQLV